MSGSWIAGKTAQSARPWRSSKRFASTYEQFLRDCGAEMLVETARLWVDLGFYSDAKGGKFCINGVTGPDEYNTVVNNNAYTNLMARENLRYAAQTVESLRATEPDARRRSVDSGTSGRRTTG